MTGIRSFGAYVPIYRLRRDLVAKAWGRPSLGGERSVANHDEDTATMAVEAAMDCLKGAERTETDALFFASTTSPYSEKQVASLVATVVDLADEVLTVDIGGSLRSATSALILASRLAESGGARNVLVTAADSRLAHPRSDMEQAFGDGAAAVLVGQEGVIAELEEIYVLTNEMMDVWRLPEDPLVRSWETRWVLSKGYGALMERAVRGLLQKVSLSPEDIQWAVLPAPDLRSHQRLSRRLGFQSEQIQDPLLEQVGYCGCAQPLMMLSAVLETAEPGQRILLASYGDGAEALLFRVTREIRDLPKRRGLQGHLDSKLLLPSYERYLSYRGLLETVPGEPFRLLPSATAYWRDRDPILRCYGSRCRQCGTLTYPLQRVCYRCRSKDDFDKVRLSDRQGTVYTFSLDNLAGRSDDPVVVQTVVELEPEGTRFYGMMTDCVPSEVKLGMRVELTFRRIHEGAGFHNYFWKCRPVRVEG
jgi:3-hydroxy-3-methylglutaryl CoA synthase